MLARIHALARRHSGYSSNLLQVHDLKLNRATHQAYYRETLLSLSRREYTLLEIFMLHPDQVLKNEQLIDKLYGFQDSIESNAINVHIYHLRQKIHADIIQTVRGVGYMFSTTEITP